MEYDMKLNENGKMTVYMIGDNQEYEIEKPLWMSIQGWKELVGLFPDERICYDDVHMLIAILEKNIVDNKDTGKDLIHSLQLSIVSKLFEIRFIQDLIRKSESYKNSKITDLIVD